MDESLRSLLELLILLLKILLWIGIGSAVLTALAFVIAMVALAKAWFEDQL